jgi:hypothetical protein
VFLNQVGKLEQDVATLIRTHLLPRWEGLFGCLDCGVNILLTSQWHVVSDQRSILWVV